MIGCQAACGEEDADGLVDDSVRVNGMLKLSVLLPQPGHPLRGSSSWRWRSRL
ncbi:hypothetical protein [Streptomyces sp. NPDC095817]|uniref:hypothetical protein n=1 Tax=Streptomyces sp. NPDC095817 TaxID=3155082 RepID=UPI00332C5B80